MSSGPDNDDDDDGDDEEEVGLFGPRCVSHGAQFGLVHVARLLISSNVGFLWPTGSNSSSLSHMRRLRQTDWDLDWGLGTGGTKTAGLRPDSLRRLCGLGHCD